MEKKKRVSFLAGESNLSDSEKKRIDEELRKMWEQNLLDAVERNAYRSRRLAESIVEIAKSPRKGLRGPQQSETLNYRFFMKCEEILTQNGNNMEKAKFEIGKFFSIGPSTASQKYYRLRKIFAPWKIKSK